MKYIFMTLFLGLSTVLFGQNNIMGVVSDVNGMPLPNVSVHLHEINKGTTTSTEGSFAFKNVPTGNLQISFVLSGFEPQRQLIKVTQPETAIQIQLLQTDHQMDEVVISTAFNRLQSENVLKVEHATLAEMRREGVINVAEGLAVIPGVSQLSTGTSIGKPVIRGLTGNRVVVYAQGIRMEN